MELRNKQNGPKEKFEVVLIKPDKEDERNNEQIKMDLMKGLDKVRKMRQMRKQGVVVEVMSQDDVEAIKSCDLKKLGLVVERPKKIDPSIIIYDVEKEYKAEELKEDLIKKNLQLGSDDETDGIKDC